MRTGAASAVGARRYNANDVTMTGAGLWRYGDWQRVATGCTALVYRKRSVIETLLLQPDNRSDRRPIWPIWRIEYRVVHGSVFSGPCVTRSVISDAT